MSTLSPPDPLALDRTAAALRLAQAEATRAAAPPSATEIARVCNEAENLRRQLWRDQIARDMAKAAEMAWEVIHVQEIDLDILEGDIAAADAHCAAVKMQPLAAATEDLVVAAARLGLAQVEYRAALAALTPTPTRTPTRTPRATPTPHPTPEACQFTRWSPAPWPGLSRWWG